MLILPLEFLSQTCGGEETRRSVLLSWIYFPQELTENASWYFSTSSFERLLNISVLDLRTTSSVLDIVAFIDNRIDVKSFAADK